MSSYSDRNINIISHICHPIENLRFCHIQVRRQGRNFGTGEIFSFKRPLPVRNIAASGRALSPSRKELKRVEAAPVFNLNDMLKKEAAKLKAKV